MQYITKEPKNTEKYFWTEHAKAKLKQYGLSPARVIRVINHPKRQEEAIVPTCIGCMQQIGNKKKTEIWAMYQLVKNKKQIKIITAWRYPGITKPGTPIPIPEDIQNELEQIIK
ncbi:MAG: hypothetical protein ABIA91_02420 [Patescibacteria group bacterium]